MYIKTNWLRSLSVVLAGALLLTAVGSYLPPGQNISPSISSFVNASPVKQLTELEKAYNWPDQGNSDHYMEFVPDEDGKVSVIIGFTGAPARGAQRQSSLAQQKSLVEIFGGDVGKGFTIINAVTARLPLKAVEALSKRHEVSYLEPDYKVTLFTQETPWGIDRIFGPEKYTFPTWDHSRGEGIAVAVLDTGIDEKCVDLPALLGGVNTIDSTHWGSDGHGHGTHVAGIIAAVDNDMGVVGAAPDAGLYAVKVMDDDGRGTYSSVIAGIEWALNQNIPVMNMSVGGDSHSKALKDAVNAAYAEGALLVAAAGNGGDSADNVFYPARYSSVIAVSASDSNAKLASFSSRGPSVELIAPGVNILSLYPGNYMTYMSGTSMACPHVAGVAAMLWGANGSLSNLELRTLMQETAQNLGLDINHQGFGLVRADLAVVEIINLPELEQTFIDVLPDMQFFPYIEALYAEGIITGYEDGTYRPNDPVTRGQMSAFLARALNLPDAGDPGNPTFSDVTPSMQFFGYIEAIYAAWITTGYGDGTYRLDEPVTRGQMGAFLARALNLLNAGDPDNPIFSDVTPSMQFFPFIEAVYLEGVTTGYGDGTYRPDELVTRGQMAAFLSRAFGLHHNDSWEPY